MDIKTGLSIYNKRWLIEPEAALQMLDVWDQVRTGATQWDYRKAVGSTSASTSYRQSLQVFGMQNIIVAPDSSYDMRTFQGFEGASVAIIPISGPLMKGDSCGDLGTQSLKQLTQLASQTDSVKVILFITDSPGGTVDGNQSLADTIKASPKYTICLVDGMMCSAAYWLGSSADAVYASSKTDIIGSIGTMISFQDNSEAMKARGVVLREFYATESTDKNRIFTDAAKGNGKALIEEFLDPLNNVFLNAVKDNRDGKLQLKKENVLTGKVYTSEKALEGGLIDGIQSYEETLQEALDFASSNKVSNILTISNTPQTKVSQSQNTNMTLAELKAQHPAIYAEAAQEGVLRERDRVGAWAAYIDVDAETVAKGIKEGAPLSMTVMAELGRKAFSKQTLTAISGDNAQTIKTGEPEAATTASDKEKVDFEAEVRAGLGLKTATA